MQVAAADRGAVGRMRERGGGLVDDAENIEAGDLAGVLGRLPLRVIEVAVTTA